MTPACIAPAKEPHTSPALGTLLLPCLGNWRPDSFLVTTQPPSLASLQPNMAASPESLTQLKEEGNILFAKKEYDRAMECYEKALKLVAGDHPDAALLHSNKAACHMMHKK